MKSFVVLSALMTALLLTHRILAANVSGYGDIF